MVESNNPVGQDTDSVSIEAKLNVVLAVIENFHTSLEHKIDTVAAGLTLLHAGHRNLASKVRNAEQAIYMIQPQAHMTKKGLLEEKAEDDIRCSHRNAMRIVGLPEHVKGQDLDSYKDQWLAVIPLWLLCCPAFWLNKLSVSQNDYPSWRKPA
ncbi:hypothetical protein NDU88_003870 [Pleurodeles waltl]|uniref:Uncharacterized protein n=1 Tax=Pleurodeles waltl TaxID=8319 RepID=A0AAV7VH57_PLEWA|nr:hypothetical protein NDU88_003870 [Pleurodeles waltl]